MIERYLRYFYGAMSVLTAYAIFSTLSVSYQGRELHGWEAVTGALVAITTGMAMFYALQQIRRGLRWLAVEKLGGLIRRDPPPSD